MLNLGGSGTTNETVYVMNGNAAYANDGYVHAGQDITFDSLTASAPFVGQYAMNFAVTGEKDAEYTLTCLLYTSGQQPAPGAAFLPPRRGRYGGQV